MDHGVLGFPDFAESAHALHGGARRLSGVCTKAVTEPYTRFMYVLSSQIQPIIDLSTKAVYRYREPHANTVPYAIAV